MSNQPDWLEGIAVGAVAGLVGTVAIQALMGASQKWLPSTMPPIRQDPGEFMVDRVEDALPDAVSEPIPSVLETAAARALGLGYGMAFGALYAVLRPRGWPRLGDGAVLGLAAWAAGYLGWLPALGLMPPVWKQRPAQVLVPIADHVVYGLATAASYDWMQNHAGNR